MLAEVIRQVNSLVLCKGQPKQLIFLDGRRNLISNNVIITGVQDKEHVNDTTNRTTILDIPTDDGDYSDTDSS